MAKLSPTPESPLKMSAKMFLVGVIAAGTGGTPQIPPDHVGYAPHVIFVEAHRKTHVVAQIQQVLQELGVSNTGLARAMCVSRQAIYNWLRGDSLKPEHQAKIDSLARASEVLRKLDVLPRALLKQPLEAGRNFWALVREGQDPETLANRLASVFQSRQRQRALVAERGAAKRARGVLADTATDDFT